MSPKFETVDYLKNCMQTTPHFKQIGRQIWRNSVAFPRTSEQKEPHQEEDLPSKCSSLPKALKPVHISVYLEIHSG